MAEDQIQQIPQDPTTALLSEFGTRLNEVEEKQRLIKDRILLVGENLISTKEKIEKQDLENRGKLNQIDFEIKTIKQLIKRIINEIQNFTRKSEVEILERQIKMFEPLEFARFKDIEQLVKQELKNQKNIKNK
jgi:phage terminase Nu1 subunit (DNA packaging protein)